MEVTIDMIKEFIANQKWIFAKTYATRAPHEYVVRDRVNASDEVFMAIASYIQTEGITMYFWNHPNHYIFVDGWQYWVMKDSDDDPTMIINRCKLDDYKLSIMWKGALKK